MRISDWSAYVCSSDLVDLQHLADLVALGGGLLRGEDAGRRLSLLDRYQGAARCLARHRQGRRGGAGEAPPAAREGLCRGLRDQRAEPQGVDVLPCRSEEHTSELQSLMRTSYAV